MLNIGPTGFGYRRHVETVALGNERDLVVGEPIGLPVPFEVAPDLIDAHLGLHGADARRHGDIQEPVRHGCSPTLVWRTTLLCSPGSDNPRRAEVSLSCSGTNVS